MIAICLGWGPCTVEEAKEQLSSLREQVLKLEHREYGGPEYEGEETFESLVDEIIEDLRQVADTFGKQELAKLLVETMRDGSVAG